MRDLDLDGMRRVNDILEGTPLPRVPEDKIEEIIHRVNPRAGLCIWSDMFDPHHNAVDNFYLVHRPVTSLAVPGSSR